MQTKTSMPMYANQNMKIIDTYVDSFDSFLTIKDFAYYSVVPTYCYQLVFPKTKRIRFMWLVQKSLKLIGLSLVNLFIFLEYTLPLLTLSTTYFRKPINFLEVYPYVQ